jgi:hypothetical protein
MTATSIAIAVLKKASLDIEKILDEIQKAIKELEAEVSLPEPVVYKIVMAVRLRMQPVRATNNIIRTLTQNTLVKVIKTTETDGHVWGQTEEGWFAIKDIQSLVVYARIHTGETFPPIQPTARAAAERIKKGNGYNFLRIYPPRRVIGANVRELVWAGSGLSGSEYAAQNLISEHIQWMSDNKMNMLRVYAPHRDANNDLILSRVTNVVDLAAAKGIAVIVCLNDALNTPYSIREDARYRSTSPEANGGLNNEYYRNGIYRQRYFPLVQKLVTGLKDRENVIWQVDNEGSAAYSEDKDPKPYLSFCADATEHIYGWSDGKQPIMLGIVNSHHVMHARPMDPIDFYRQIPRLSAIQGHHYYDGDEKHSPAITDDIAVAHAFDIPYYMDEFGVWNGMEFVNGRWVYTRHRSRVDDFIRITNELYNAGVAGILQWALMTGAHDSAMGHHTHGLDRIIHKDEPEVVMAFEALKGTIQNLSDAIF